MNFNTVLKGTIINISKDNKYFEIETDKGEIIVSVNSDTIYETPIENAKGVKIFGHMFDPEQITATIITKI